MQRIASFVGGTVLILVLSAAAARADNWHMCLTAEGDEQIAACSRLIAAGHLHGHDLAGVYIGRSIKRGMKKVTSMEPSPITIRRLSSTRKLQSR